MAMKVVHRSDAALSGRRSEFGTGKPWYCMAGYGNAGVAGMGANRYGRFGRRGSYWYVTARRGAESKGWRDGEMQVALGKSRCGGAESGDVMQVWEVRRG